MINKQFKIYFLGSALFAIGQAFLGVLLNLKLSAHGYTTATIGLLQSAIGLGFLLSLPAGLLTENIRMRWILVSSTLFYILSMSLIAFTSKIELLLLAGIILGGAGGVRSTVSGPWFMAQTTKADRSFIFGWSSAIDVGASVIGTLIAGFCPTLFIGIETDRYAYSILIGSIIATFSIPLFFLIQDNKKIVPIKSLNNCLEILIFQIKKLKPKRNLNTRQMIDVMIPSTIVSVGAGLTIPFLNLYLQETFLLSVTEIGHVFAAISAFMFLGLFFAPILGRRFGILRVVILSQSLSLPFMLILAITPYASLAIVSMMVRSSLMNMGGPLAKQFQFENIDSTLHPIFNVYLLVGWSLANMTGSFFGGLLIKEYGFRITIIITAIFYSVSTYAYSRLPKSSQRNS